MQSHTSQALSVSAVAKFIQGIISQNISNLWIRGEVSNFKYQPNGNSYFSIKDPEAKINAIIMANSPARKAAPDMKNGVEVLLYGKISYYKKEGYLTVFVEEVEFLGEGILKQKYDELKKKLEGEGLFNREHKKRIPAFPNCVGVVTSPTGAAIQDILNVTNRRFGSINIIVFPAAVQGENAAKEIADAIGVANRYASDLIDVLIVGRGGGSIEDLWCFNEEAVARAIYASQIPVISAVGHEIDYTIADYVADLRAPTPSAAAEIVVKDRAEILRYIGNLKNRAETLFQNQFEHVCKTIRSLNKDYLQRLMGDTIGELSLTMENFKIRFLNKINQYLQNTKASIYLQREKLEALNPGNILKRGYTISYITAADGTQIPLHSYAEIGTGEIMQTRFSDGTVRSKVQ